VCAACSAKGTEPRNTNTDHCIPQLNRKRLDHGNIRPTKIGDKCGAKALRGKNLTNKDEKISRFKHVPYTDFHSLSCAATHNIQVHAHQQMLSEFVT